jgi:hypothetical protein
MKKLFALMLAFSFAMVTVGCDQPDTPAENAADRIEDATDDASDAVEEAGDEIEQNADEAAENTVN